MLMESFRVSQKSSIILPPDCKDSVKYLLNLIFHGRQPLREVVQRG